MSGGEGTWHREGEGIGNRSLASRCCHSGPAFVIKGHSFPLFSCFSANQQNRH